MDSDSIATQLIEKGKLRKRVTMIPLNKVADTSARPEVSVLLLLLPSVFVY